MSKTPLIIIPARFASKRLPGKPLEKIGNKTLIEHAVASALLSKHVGAANICVATDDELIVTRLKSIKPVGLPEWLNVFMTDEDLETGTDRCAQAIEEEYGWSEKCPDWVINVQGDMPWGTAKYIERVIAACQAEPQYDMITPICMKDVVYWDTGVKYFARQTLTAGHVGIYAYRKAALREFYECSQAAVEVNESSLLGRQYNAEREIEIKTDLEQNRAVKMGLKIKRLEVYDLPMPIEINTYADLYAAQELANEVCQSSD